MTNAATARRTDERGWSLFETMVAIGLVATGLLVVVQQLSISFRESASNEQRAFAYQKAAAILGEIQNAIATGRITKGAELQALADEQPQIVLTTRLDDEGLPFAPDQPMSGNVQRQGHWLWARRVHVEPAVETGLWFCRVELLRWSDLGRWDAEATQALQFSLLPEPDAPEQAIDVWVLACGAAPSLSGDLAELRTHVETAAAQIGLQSQAAVRLHWITRLGYGRDPCYAPFLNTETPANKAEPLAYWLPGQLGAQHEGSWLYRPELLGAMFRSEQRLLGGGSVDNPWPVTVADQNNHCMRTPAARALFDRRVAAGLERADEPPLQLLLDDLVARPQLYRNAVFVNLHAPGLPMPPLRNYADAARVPETLPGVRVVTHPARLQTARDPNGDGNHADTQPLDLRVYAYRTDGTGDVLTEPILVQIFGADLTTAINGSSPTLLVNRLQGGIDPTTGSARSGTRTYVGFDEAGGVAPTTGEAPFAMHYEAGFVAGSTPYTWLKLYNTPLVAPPVGNRGLQPGARLYGLDYCPSPVDGASPILPPFARDLAHDSQALEMRNTARWRIRIPASVFSSGKLANVDQTIRVVTRIGGSTNTGIRWPQPVQPLNASETFAWWTRSATAVPATERAQFLGDPRLNPYLDLMAGSATFAHGYNWHFDNLVAGKTGSAVGYWPGFDPLRLQDGFDRGNHADVPRFLQLLRQGLQASGSVLVLPFGKVAESLLLGGEIVTCPGGVEEAVEVTPTWTGGTTAVDTLRASGSNGARVLTKGTSFKWWAQPWLGELFPDSQWATWYLLGNLPIDGSVDGLRWQLLHTANPQPLPLGTVFDAPQGSYLGDFGGTMLLDSGNPGATFMSPDAGSTVPAQPTVGQNEINVATNLVPPSQLMSPWEVTLQRAIVAPPAAYTMTDTYPRSIATQLQPLWVRDARTIGALFDCAQVSSQRAFFVCNALPPGSTSLREHAEQMLLSGIRALHVGGTPGLAGRVVQVPRVQILEPETGTALPPDAIHLRWKTDWRRFDDQGYTIAYPQGFAESESDLIYRVLWSADNGATWTSALTGTTAVPGTYPEPGDSLADTANGSESWTVASAASLPDGEYVFVVEAWRASTRCHSGSHRVKVMINHAAVAKK